jgi:hypothetical protein
MIVMVVVVAGDRQIKGHGLEIGMLRMLMRTWGTAIAVVTPLRIVVVVNNSMIMILWGEIRTLVGGREG